MRRSRPPPFLAQARAIYPDMGVAAMLQSQWPDIKFNLSSLNDRRPVGPNDDLVVIATPDPQGLEVGLDGFPGAYVVRAQNPAFPSAQWLESCSLRQRRQRPLAA